MAQGRNTINQRISIEGALDVIRQLKDMGEAGEAALKKITDAAEASNGATSRIGQVTDKVREHFTKVKEAVEPVKEKFTELHESVHKFGERLEQAANRTIPHFRQVAEIAFAGSAIGLIEMIKKAAEFAVEIHKTSEEVGLSEEKWQQFNFVLRSTGVNQERVISTFSRLARAVGDAIVETRKHLGDLAEKLGGDSPINDIILGGGDKKRQEDGARKVRSTGGALLTEVDKAARQIRNEMVRQASLVGQNITQLPGVDFFKNRIAKVFDELTPAAAKLRTELFKYTDLNIPAKTVAEFEERVKSLGSEMDVLFKKVFKVDFLDAQGRARELSSVFDEVGQALDRMTDEGTKAYYAQLVFSRGFKEVLPLFRDNAAELKKLRQEWHELGVELTGIEIAEGLKVYGAFAKLTLVIENLQGKILAVFSPILIDLIDGITDAINHSTKAVLQFAEGVATDLMPGVKDFLHVLESGFKEEAHVEWVRTLISGFKFVGEVISVLVGAFRAFIAIAERVADRVNAIFGTKWTGEQLAAVVTVGLVIGVFGLLATALTTVLAIANVIGALIAAPWVALGIAVGVVAAAIVLFWPEVKKDAQDTAEFIAERWNYAVDTITGAFDHAIDVWKDRFQSFKNWFNDLIKSIGDKISEIFGRLGQSVDTGGVPLITQSGGGPVPGSGQGDHVHILAEPGEFMVKRSTVSQLGLGFMNALNQGMVGRFSMGGIIDGLRSVSPQPLRMATGGLIPAAADGRATFHLSIEGTSFHGLSAPTHVANNLLQFARSSSIVSAGKKPSWSGSG